MSKISKINSKNKWWIRFILIPFVLFCVWVALTFWYIVIFDQSALVLSYNHPTSDFTQITYNRLLKGQKLAGEFVAKDNNLGIVAIRFKSFERIPYNQEDTLIFRLKQKGQKGWYYQNQYRSGLTFDVPFLPFGFPIIPDSKGRTYDFELESLHGNNINGVALSTRQPFLVTKYKADKKVLLKNPRAFLMFIFKKIFNSFDTIDISYSSFLFALPFIFYMIYVSRIKPYIPRYSVGVFVIVAILIDICFLQLLNDLLYIEVPILWLFLMREEKLDSRYTFLSGLIFLLFAPLYLQLNIEEAAQIAASWAFMFLFAGTIQACISTKVMVSKSKPRVLKD